MGGASAANSRRQTQRRRGAVAVFREVMLGRSDGVEPQIFSGTHQRDLLMDDLVLCLADGVFEQMKHSEAHVGPS